MATLTLSDDPLTDMFKDMIAHPEELPQVRMGYLRKKLVSAFEQEIERLKTEIKKIEDTKPTKTTEVVPLALTHAARKEKLEETRLGMTEAMLAFDNRAFRTSRSHEQNLRVVRHLISHAIETYGLEYFSTEF